MNIEIKDPKSLLNEIRSVTLLASILPDNIKELMFILHEEVQKQELKRQWYVDKDGKVCNRKEHNRSYSVQDLVEVLNSNNLSDYKYEHEPSHIQDFLAFTGEK